MDTEQEKAGPTLETISQQLADIRERQAWILMNLIVTQAGLMKPDPGHPLSTIEILRIAMNDSEGFDSLVELLRPERREVAPTTAPHSADQAHTKGKSSR